MPGSTRLRAFIREQSGAVAVDWVVLSALLVALGFGVTNVVSTAAEELTQDIRANLETDHLRNPFDVEEEE